MASEIIKAFYHSRAWRSVRALKVQLSKGTCEMCGKAGWEVHHKTPLTDANVGNPIISLNVENLQLLCTKCHNAQRDKRWIRPDLKFDSEGNVLPRISPPRSSK